MSKSYNQQCPIARTLDIVGDRWTWLIVRELLRGDMGDLKAQLPKWHQGWGFVHLRGRLPGISPTTLSARLKRLEEHGLIERTLDDGHPPRTFYCLTESGQQLWKPLRAIGMWGTEHLDLPVERVHDNCGGRVTLSFACDACGEELVEDGQATLNWKAGRKPTDDDGESR